MNDSALPNDVRTFVNMYIDSIELLEVLILLRTETDKAWSIPDVARALTLTHDSATLRLKELERRRLVHRDQGDLFSYDAHSLGVEETVERVAEAYSKRRTRLIALIFSGASESIRGFADAFRLRDDR